MDVVDTAEDAAGLELPPLVVREPLEAFLDAHGIGEGRLEAERIGEGHSNITFLVRRGDARVVLRRPPRPPLPPSAHDVLREARLLKALEGTARARAEGDRRRRRRDGAGRAVLRDGGDARKRAGERDPARHSTPPRSAGARPRSSWTRSWSCTTWTGARAGSRATASPPATSSARCGASAGSGSTTRPASCRWWRSWASGSGATCRSHPSRRSCTATTGSAT